ncbi:hypothetical protein L249_4939 [Ophiocordyceps polyrhachis-furcata BCC 54312]|uniref:Uncharacterized protein n=1 Tax=Ophiocordyceps polyrhachis-furcata BCC 54312 TaxID=1330021 RepID=A0A367L3Q4_9HYPO|nr:hypothetical protein L249_4939 [Ophiocordyceps polyrhachis-furcata BCC 54312]
MSVPSLSFQARSSHHWLLPLNSPNGRLSPFRTVPLLPPPPARAPLTACHCHANLNNRGHPVPLSIPVRTGDTPHLLPALAKTFSSSSLSLSQNTTHPFFIKGPNSPP